MLQKRANQCKMHSSTLINLTHLLKIPPLIVLETPSSSFWVINRLHDVFCTSIAVMFPSKKCSTHNKWQITCSTSSQEMTYKHTLFTQTLLKHKIKWTTRNVRDAATTKLNKLSNNNHNKETKRIIHVWEISYYDVTIEWISCTWALPYPRNALYEKCSKTIAMPVTFNLLLLLLFFIQCNNCNTILFVINIIHVVLDHVSDIFLWVMQDIFLTRDVQTEIFLLYEEFLMRRAALVTFYKKPDEDESWWMSVTR